jgi:FtsP/CotA-like multicopper oxidase with cupredoxin domain
MAKKCELGFLFLLIVAIAADVTTFNFTVDYCERAPDGAMRVMYCINDIFPGPTIEAMVGDTVQINVTNNLMSEVISLHFHGLYQQGSPYMDGAVGVTEYGILPQSNYMYSFVLNQTGTYWYHSHVVTQYGDGISGVFIARDNSSQINNNQSDLSNNTSELTFNQTSLNNNQTDLNNQTSPNSNQTQSNQTTQFPEHVVLISDWFWDFGFKRAARLENGDFQQIVNSGSFFQSALINGKGQADCTNPLASGIACNNSAQLERFNVQPGQTHLFRIIGAMTTFPVQFAIQGHVMTIVAMDGQPVVPKNMSIINLQIGQRYDVLVNATQTPNDYWVVAQTFLGPWVSAVLSYNNQSTTTPPAIQGQENFMPNRNSPTFPFRLVNEIAQNITMQQPQQAPNATQFLTFNILCNDQVGLCFMNGIKFKQGNEPILYADYNGRTPQAINHTQGAPQFIPMSGSCNGNNNNNNNTNGTSSGGSTSGTCDPFQTTVNLNNNGWLAVDIELDSESCDQFSFIITVDNQTFTTPAIVPGSGTLDWIILPEQLQQGSHNITIQPNAPDCAKQWNGTFKWFLGIEGEHVIQVQGSDVVQVTINNLGSLAHPFHFHGHSLYMLGYGKPSSGVFDPQQANTTLIQSPPPRRDSFLVESHAWTVFVFVPNSPGAWGMHCHIEWHYAAGLAMVWNVDPNNVPAPPVSAFNPTNLTNSGSSSQSSSSQSSSSQSSSSQSSNQSSSQNNGNGNGSDGNQSNNGPSGSADTNASNPSPTITSVNGTVSSGSVSVHGLSFSFHLLSVAIILFSRWVSC